MFMCTRRSCCWSGHDRPHGRPKDRVHGVNWRREDHHEECRREQRQEGLPGARGEVPTNYLRGLRLGQSRQIGRQEYNS